MEISDIQAILRLFKGSLFPRTISSHATQGKQIPVGSIDEIFDWFKASNFVDCRINAYSVHVRNGGFNTQPPDFVMSDLDLTKFRTEKLILKSLDETVTNVDKDFPGTVPMVLFTGGGYHVYEPIDMPILEEESIFRHFEKPSTEFIRYAAQRWTNGKNDASNHPSVNSCLLRVPGSINSKNNKEVEIVQEWNGKRPAANKILFDFYIKLAAKKLAERCPSKQKEMYYYPTTHHFQKNYKHFGHMPLDPTVNAVDGITWIDNILDNGGFADCRKTLIDLVLAPYLVNIKQCDYDMAYNTIIQWLDKCGQKCRLTFSSRYKVRYALNRSRQNGIKPMKFETMKNDYSDMYQEIVNQGQQQ